ncbi:MAG TPA: zf-HC2 domain-containing protein [Bryobacteraceae bacterium]|nr:zf-HC2 domain-containing protein [Bryobacteraceae bacterium]
MLGHEPEERLELYVLGRLAASELVRVEEHLLLCESCRNRLDEIEAVELAFRDEFRKQSAGFREKPTGWAWMLRPQFALATALGVAVIGIGVFRAGSNTPNAPVASLQLTAIRGSAMPAVNAARELDLSLSDLPTAGGPFRLEVVDGAGSRIWTGTAENARIEQRLSPGDYFARLYSASGQLLHEYGFRVIS